ALPGEAAAHHQEGELREPLGEEPLARLPLPFDELHHRHLQAPAECAEHRAQRRGGLALAVAGVDHDEAALLPLAHVRSRTRSNQASCSRSRTTSPTTTSAGGPARSSAATRSASVASVPTTTCCSGMVPAEM